MANATNKPNPRTEEVDWKMQRLKDATLVAQLAKPDQPRWSHVPGMGQAARSRQELCSGWFRVEKHPMKQGQALGTAAAVHCG